MPGPPVDTEVQQVLGGPNEWRDKDIYDVLFADRDGKHSFFVPKGDDAPTDGGKERGWFDVKQNGEPKFSRASDKAPANGGQRRSKGSSDDFERRPDHPQTQQRMRHTTALSAAPGYIEQILTIKATEQPVDWDGYWTLVETVVAKLEATYPPASPASE